MKDESQKALKRIKKLIAQEVEDAYNRGFEEGSEDSSYEYQNGYQDGAREERERIKTIFDMNIQWALESNKGSDVVFFTKAKQIIEPIDVDLSEEAYRRSLEADGF